MDSLHADDIGKDPELAAKYAKVLDEVIKLKAFLITAPTSFERGEILKRYPLVTDEVICCIFWNNVFYVTGTDIVRCLVYRFEAFGRIITNRKKFEEGIFSDLRNLKCDSDAILEEPKSEFLEFLYRNNCIRTQKKQKVFHWFSVGHDRLFLDALERDLKKESTGKRASTEATGEPALSFKYDPSQTLYDQLSHIIDGIPKPLAAIADASTSCHVMTSYPYNVWPGGAMPPGSTVPSQIYGSRLVMSELSSLGPMGPMTSMPNQQGPSQPPNWRPVNVPSGDAPQPARQEQVYHASHQTYPSQRVPSYGDSRIYKDSPTLESRQLYSQPYDPRQDTLVHQDMQQRMAEGPMYAQYQRPMPQDPHSAPQLAGDVEMQADIPGLHEEPILVKPDVDSDFPLDYFHDSTSALSIGHGRPDDHAERPSAADFEAAASAAMSAAGSAYDDKDRRGAPLHSSSGDTHEYYFEHPGGPQVYDAHRRLPSGFTESGTPHNASAASTPIGVAAPSRFDDGVRRPKPVPMRMAPTPMGPNTLHHKVSKQALASYRDKSRIDRLENLYYPTPSESGASDTSILIRDTPGRYEASVTPGGPPRTEEGAHYDTYAMLDVDYWTR